MSDYRDLLRTHEAVFREAAEIFGVSCGVVLTEDLRKTLIEKMREQRVQLERLRAERDSLLLQIKERT